MNLFSKIKYLFLFVIILSEVLAENEDNLYISFYGRSGKTNVRPTTPTEPPEIELEPETEPETEPDIQPVPEYEPELEPIPIIDEPSEPEHPWHPINITHKPTPETWRPPTTTRRPTFRPEPEWTRPPTRRTTLRPEPEWTRPPTRRTTPRPEPEWTRSTTRWTTPRPEPEWTRSTTRRTTPRPEPEWTRSTTHRTTPRPEPEWTRPPTRRTTPRPEPQWTHPVTHRPEPEPERTTRAPQPEYERPTTTRKPRPESNPEPERPSTTRKPYPEPEQPWPESPSIPGVAQACRNIRCRSGYRCDCVNLCPSTCKNPNKNPCPANGCNARCVCDHGYVLNVNGTCVTLRECPRPPTTGQIICNELCTDGKQCACENPCPATCDNPDPIPCPTLQCNPSCYTVCKKGFVLDRIGGDCIPLQYCPNRQCIAQPCAQHENEVYYECSTRFCNRTCENPNLQCTGQCVRPGNLDCRPGYVRDLRNGGCIAPQQCSQPILCERKDEVFYECETRMCQPTCQRPNPTCAAVCRQPGNCDCKPGLVRDVKTCRCVDKNESSCLAQRISDE